MRGQRHLHPLDSPAPRIDHHGHPNEPPGHLRVPIDYQGSTLVAPEGLRHKKPLATVAGGGRV